MPIRKVSPGQVPQPHRPVEPSKFLQKNVRKTEAFIHKQTISFSKTRASTNDHQWQILSKNHRSAKKTTQFWGKESKDLKSLFFNLKKAKNH